MLIKELLSRTVSDVIEELLSRTVGDIPASKLMRSQNFSQQTNYEDGKAGDKTGHLIEYS